MTKEERNKILDEVAESDKVILGVLLDAVSGSDQRFMEEQGIFLENRSEHIGAIKIIKHLIDNIDISNKLSKKERIKQQPEQLRKK